MSTYSANNQTTPISLLTCLLLATQISCAPPMTKQIIIPTKNKQPLAEQKTPAEESKATIAPSQEKISTPHISQLPSLYTDDNHTLPPKKTGVSLPTEKVQLNVENMPLNRFIHMALGDVLKQSFYVDEKVTKRTDPITLHITSPIKASRLLGLIQQTLSAFDVAITETSKGMNVIPISKLKLTPPSLLSEKSRSLIQLGRKIEIIPLNYALPGEVISFASQFLNIGKSAEVSVNRRLNALIVIGEPQRVEQYKQLVKFIDKPSAQGKYIRLLRPGFWKNKELIDVLKSTLSAQGIKTTNGASSSGIRLIEVKSLNGIIVTSPKKEWLMQTLSLFEKLDIPSAHGESITPYIYFVKNTRAEELGNIINHVYLRISKSIGDYQTTPPKTKDKSIKSEDKVESAETTSSFFDHKDNKKTPTVAAKKTIINNDLPIITDVQRNALIFVGTGEEYNKILPVIKSLDILPRQILIEATIAEVTLTNDLKLGVEWQINNLNIGAVAGSLGTLNGLDLAAGGLAGSLGYKLIDQAGAVRALINAKVTEGKAKILSSPRILAMDNEAARIQVGDQLLVVTGEIANTNSVNVDTSATGVVRSFSYVDTGIILNVTPSINDGGIIQLKLQQEVSDAKASPNNTPTIFKRAIDTTLIVNSGQSILIGGLISHKEDVVESKVPLLGDIPYLGYLFKTQNKIDRVTELVIIITPHIIDSPDNSLQFLEEFQYLSPSNSNKR